MRKKKMNERVWGKESETTGSYYISMGEIMCF
jgi:hypothetical protein